MSLGTKGRCKICGELFLYKDLIAVPKKPEEKIGFNSIFDTGYNYYCKKCMELSK